MHNESGSKVFKMQINTQHWDSHYATEKTFVNNSKVFLYSLLITFCNLS